jgi:hypothetical protein
MDAWVRAWEALGGGDAALFGVAALGVLALGALGAASAGRVRVPAVVWWAVVLAPVTLGAGEALLGQQAALGALGEAPAGLLGERAALALKLGRSAWAHGLLLGGALAAWASVMAALGAALGAGAGARVSVGHAATPGAMGLLGGLLAVIVGTALGEPAPLAGMLGVLALFEGLVIASACARIASEPGARERTAAGRGRAAGLGLGAVLGIGAGVALRDGWVVAAEWSVALGVVALAGALALLPVLPSALRPRAVIGAAGLALLGALPLGLRLASWEAEASLRLAAPDPIAIAALSSGLSLPRCDVDGPPPHRACVVRWSKAGPEVAPPPPGSGASGALARCDTLPVPAAARPLVVAEASVGLAELQRVRWAAEAHTLELLSQGPNALGALPVRWTPEVAAEAVPTSLVALVEGQALVVRRDGAAFAPEGQRGALAEVAGPLREEARKSGRPLGVLAGRGATVADLAAICATPSGEPVCVLLPWRSVAGAGAPPPWIVQLLPKASE